MPVITRAYYHASFRDFLTACDEEILAHLSLRSGRSLNQSQRNAWIGELDVLRQVLEGLEGLDGFILLEYSIPRMGRRADSVLLFSKVVIVIEFKVGEARYTAHALDQVFDYALDLKNFHKQSHDKFIVPVLLATDAPPWPLVLEQFSDGLFGPVCANSQNVAHILREAITRATGPEIDFTTWLDSAYCPTPTIVEAAQALYRGHNIEEISRSEAGAENLTKTAEAITQILSERVSKKLVCEPGGGS